MPSVQLLPKLHLHCHLEGAMRAQTFVELAHQYGIETAYKRERDAGIYEFTNFQEFLLTFAAVGRSLAKPEDYQRLAREFAEDAIAQNVMYGELFISPQMWKFFHPDINVRACLEAIHDGFTIASGVTFRFIFDIVRNFGVEAAMEAAHLAGELTDLGVIGIGIGGDEANFPPELFADVFTFARAQGLHCVAHAGEAAGAQSVKGAIDALQAERIGHGIRALEDPEVVRLVAERGIPLDICPTSNFRTGIIAGEHPILQLDAVGCVVTVDADDPAIFRTSISDEYAYVVSRAGEATMSRFIANAIDASFADASSKQFMRKKLWEAGREESRNNVGA